MSACSGAGESTWGEPRPHQSCDSGHEVLQYTVDTDMGAVGIYRYEGSCREAGHWVMRGFVHEGQPGNLRAGPIRSEPQDVEAHFVEPYWVRISSRDDGESRHLWDFVAHPNQDGSFESMRCLEPTLEDGRPRLEQCRGYNERGQWSNLALKIGAPALFDEEVMRILMTTDEEPRQMIAYLSETWGERDEEERQRIREAWEQLDCVRFTESEGRLWRDYYAMTRKVWGEEDVDRALRQCDETFVKDWRNHSEHLSGRLTKPWVIEGLDREFASLQGPLDEVGTNLLMARLEHEPEPDPHLFNRMDEHLISQMITEESINWQELKRRLGMNYGVSETNIELITAHLLECCREDEEFVEMMEFDDFEPVLHQFDEAIVALAAELSRPTDSLMKRLDIATYMPLSGAARAQLDDLIVEKFVTRSEKGDWWNDFAEVARRWIAKHSDEQQRDQLVRRLDDNALEIFRQTRGEEVAQTWRGDPKWFPATAYLRDRLANAELPPMEDSVAEELAKEGLRLAYLRVKRFGKPSHGLPESMCVVLGFLHGEEFDYDAGERECRLPPGAVMGEDDVHRLQPQRIPVAREFRHITAGHSHGCAVAADSTLWCWGHGQFNYNGQEDRRDRAAPFQVKSNAEIATGWLFVEGGPFHNCGIRDDATMWCWGSSGSGGLGVESPSSSAVLHQVEGDTEFSPGWVDVAAGRNHSCAIRDDSTLWCWGDQNRVGKVGVRARGVPDVHERPQQLVADEPINEGWASVTAGRDHSCAIRDDSSLWCWGRGPEGALGLGEFWTLRAAEAGPRASEDVVLNQWRPAKVEEGTALEDGWSMVSAGGEHTCAIRDDSSLWCWGKGLGQGHRTLRWRSRPEQVDAGEAPRQGWASVSAGETSTCAIRDDGSLWCWGRGLATGTGETVVGPRQVGSSQQWVAVSVGDSHAHGLRSDGSVWSWGENLNGRLGTLALERHTMLDEWESDSNDEE